MQMHILMQSGTGRRRIDALCVVVGCVVAHAERPGRGRGKLCSTLAVTCALPSRTPSMQIISKWSLFASAAEPRDCIDIQIQRQRGILTKNWTRSRFGSGKVSAGFNVWIISGALCALTGLPSSFKSQSFLLELSRRCCCCVVSVLF